MNYREVFGQSVDSIRSNKLRSVLTLLALVIGVFSIILSTTVVASIDSFFSQTMSFMGSDVINVQRTPAVQMGRLDDNIRNRKRITFQTAEDLQEQLRIAEGLSPDETFSFTDVQFGEEETEPDVRIKGSNEHYIENNAYNIEDGRNFTPDDIQYARNFAIIGKDVQNDLFQTQYPLGKNIRIDGKSYQIIGIMEAKGQIFGSSLDNFVLIPYTTALNTYGGVRNIDIQVRAPAFDLIEATVEEITGIMRVIRKVAPGEENDFEVDTNDSLSGVFDAFTGALYMGGFAIGFITLLGAGIGVMNIMLVSVTERTKEIGIRKAIGATKKAIINQFLMEAIIICQLGGLIGIILGIAGGNGVAMMMNTANVIPVWSIFGGFVGMLVVGLVFGVYPAYKAAQLDPIESLRYE